MKIIKKIILVIIKLLIFLNALFWIAVGIKIIRTSDLDSTKGIGTLFIALIFVMAPFALYWAANRRFRFDLINRCNVLKKLKDIFTSKKKGLHQQGVSEKSIKEYQQGSLPSSKTIDLIPDRNSKRRVIIMLLFFLLGLILLLPATVYAISSKSIFSVVILILALVVAVFICLLTRKTFIGLSSCIDLENGTIKIIDKGFFKFHYCENRFNTVKKIAFDVYRLRYSLGGYYLSIETDCGTHTLGTYRSKKTAHRISLAVSNYYNVPIDYSTNESNFIFKKSRELSINPAYNYSSPPGAYFLGGLVLIVCFVPSCVRDHFYIPLPFIILVASCYFFTYYRANKNLKTILESDHSRMEYISVTEKQGNIKISKDRAVKPSPANLLKASIASVGTLLAGFGMAEVFAETNLMPSQWKFENYGWFLIVLGYSLMLPLIISAFKKVHTPNKDA